MAIPTSLCPPSRPAPVWFLAPLFFAAACAVPLNPPARPLAPEPAPAPAKAAPAPAPPPPPTRTGVFVDPDITKACGIVAPKYYFEYDSSDLRASEDSGLDGVVACLRDGVLKARNVEIVGRADPRGTEAYNQQLGQQRADSVGGYLAGLGVGAKRIATRSTGETRAKGTDETGWAYDRRVDILLVK